jgi:hypothetical protein
MEYYDNQLIPETAIPVQVTAPEILTDIDAALESGGAISGQVIAEDGGQPLNDVNVIVYDQDWNYKASLYFTYNGFYTIAGLPSQGFHKKGILDETISLRAYIG